MDSDPCVFPSSQPTQLLQHALATQTQEHGQGSGLASPDDDNITAIDFSLNSRIMPAQPATPRYHLHTSLMRSPDGAPTESSQSENCQENVQAEIPATSSAASSNSNAPLRGPDSEPFNRHGDSAVSASAAKVIGTRTVSFQSPPTTARVHPLSRPSSSMPVGNKPYRRSPSCDSFGGPVSQDPVEQYLASTKQFDVPLSELGETPTQEVIHSPADSSAVLPDASEHKEFVEAAVREYEKNKAERIASSNGTYVLVAATPSNSGEFSGPSQLNDDGFFRNHDSKSAGKDFEFGFSGSSSFDKMLARDLTDPPDPTPDSTHPMMAEPAQADVIVDAEPLLTGDGTQPGENSERPPAFDWIAPRLPSTNASTNPRSLLRMAHPGNQYRMAKMRNLASHTEPPSCVATGAGTQPSHVEETQACEDELAPPNASSPTRPVLHPPSTHFRRSEGNAEPEEDVLDIVPDSEPLRAGSSTQTPSLHRTAARSPLKRQFHPLSPMSEHASGELVPDSPEAEESEADVPLAVELSSTKKSVEPPKEMAVHSRKTRTYPTIPKKASSPAAEKQSRIPSSSTKGKNRKIKASKTEPTEVPTSLPEQDLNEQVLSSRQLLDAAVNNSSSNKKRRGSGSTRARHDVPKLLPVTRSLAGTKRYHKSDTESSGESSYHPDDDDQHRAQKEEEEETDSAGYSPPPPPIKSETSRKRRRTEDMSAARGMSKSSTSTGNKRSETPGIATRSGKRLRSTVSSTRGISMESATRVFALWKQDGHYYSGLVYSHGQKNKYLIKFDDGTEDEVELKNMRIREPLVGDRVIIMADGAKAVVSDVSRVHSRGLFTLEVDNGKDITSREVEFGDIRVANRTIQSQWSERNILAENIIPAVRPKPLTVATPSRQSMLSVTSGESQRKLAKTGFVVTISPKNERPLQKKDEAMQAIKQHGGLVIEDWSNVFTMGGKHSQSNKRWVARPDDFCWKPETKLERVFLLSDDAHQKPKFLLALALGIPCLSFDWLTKSQEISTDWQPFLLPAGYSDPLGARLSQLVDLDWGNCTEHLSEIMKNNVPIKLFLQKTVLCIGAELVPLPPAKKNASDEASRYVPWIILCMGATQVEAITDTKQVSAKYMQGFDYIIVKKRSTLANVDLGEKTVVADVQWVKQCLISFRLFTPSLE